MQNSFLKWLINVVVPPGTYQSPGSALNTCHWKDFKKYFSSSKKFIVVSHVVLICIFLLTNYVEHVFMCLFSICVSQGKCYSNILPCWVVWLLIIELLVLSYLGYNSFIRYTFACIISQSVACLFIFEQCWRAKLIILMKLNLDFFLYYLCFLFLSKKLCLT